jgi:SpoIID/LytB domain protein
MSQNGANYLAQQGKSFEEILLHYYPGCVVQ